MAIVVVNAGICGFETRIVSQADDLYNVTFEITSDCPQIRKMAEQLRQLLGPCGTAAPNQPDHALRGGGRLQSPCCLPGAIRHPQGDGSGGGHGPARRCLDQHP